MEFSSSLNPVGSGARATGMGGAFIAVADDATAASWNPAGLVQLEKPEFSVVLSGSSREQSYISETHPELNTANRMSTEGLNFASLVYPFLFCDPGKTSCRNAVFSLSFQRLYDTDKTVRTVYNYPPPVPGDNLPLNIDFEQTGYLHALSPALALQVTPSLYAGAAMNIWNSALDKNGWEQTTRIFGSGTFGGGPFSYDATESKKVEFEGFNMNFGFLWNVTSSFTVGGVYKTPFEASLKTTTQTTDNLAGTSTSLMKDQKLRMPQSYGIGSQYKFSQNMLIALDAYRTAVVTLRSPRPARSVRPVQSDPYRGERGHRSADRFLSAQGYDAAAFRRRVPDHFRAAGGPDQGGSLPRPGAGGRQGRPLPRFLSRDRLFGAEILDRCLLSAQDRQERYERYCIAVRQ